MTEYFPTYSDVHKCTIFWSFFPPIYTYIDDTNIHYDVLVQL